MNTVDPLLTAREVAAFLQISQPTLYRRIADGTLPKPVKLGSLSRWPQSEILAALKAAGDRRAA
jgi:excisionase family DNA binding protein